MEYHHILQRAKDADGNLLRKNLGADAGIGQINLDPLKKHLGLAGDAGKGEALKRISDNVLFDSDEEEKKDDDDDGDGDIFAQMAEADGKENAAQWSQAFSMADSI